MKGIVVLGRRLWKPKGVVGDKGRNDWALVQGVGEVLCFLLRGWRVFVRFGREES